MTEDAVFVEPHVEDVEDVEDSWLLSNVTDGLTSVDELDTLASLQLIKSQRTAIRGGGAMGSETGALAQRRGAKAKARVKR